MKIAHFVFAALAFAATLLSAQPNLAQTAASPAPSNAFDGLPQANPAKVNQLAENYGKIALSFEANQGQTDRRVKFLSHGSGYTLFLTGDEAVFSLPRKPQDENTAGRARFSRLGTHHEVSAETIDSVLMMKLLKADSSANVIGEEELPGKSDYFIGNDAQNWHTNVPTYAKVRYQDVYRGIDLVYYGNQQQLEYDFVVSPGADPRRIQFDIRGADKIRTYENGDLILCVPGGELRWHKPLVYQEQNGTRQTIDSRYVVRRGHRVSLEVGKYDSRRALVIDPALSYSTLLGGTTGFADASGIAVDSAGNAYVTGYTRAWDFPTTPGAFQTSCPSGNACGTWGAAFITKINPTGTALVYSTYLGGNQGAWGEAIAINAAGDAYVTGGTYSNNFPTTPGVVQPFCGGCGYNSQILGAAFVTELNPSGSGLIYSTYLGGYAATDYSIQNGYSVAIDPSGDAYIAGSTNSAIFPTTPGAFQTKCGSCNAPGNNNGFVTEFNSTGTALIYSTYLGGSASDEASGIALDEADEAYVTGSTLSTNFPVTPGAFQTTCSEPYCWDIFVTKLNSAGSALIYSTFLGGGITNGTGEAQFGIAIVVAANGEAYVTGETGSPSFPTTPGAFQTTCHNCVSGGGSAFVTQFNSAGSALIYSTYLGGSSEGTFAEGAGIVLDAAGDAYLNGETNTPDFPTTPGSFQTTCGGCSQPFYSAFMSELNPTGSTLLYSTYLTGSNTPVSTSTGGSGLAIDANNGVYLVGSTYSPGFPVTPGAFQTSVGPNGDSFIAKFVPGDQVWPLALNFGNQPIGVASTAQSTVLTNSGTTALAITSITFTGANSGDFSQQNTCGTSLPAGQSCTINVTFTPSAPGSRTATLDITDSAVNSPQTVALSGTGTVNVTLVPSNLNFGSEGLGSTSQPQPVTLSTNGTLIINSIFANPPFAQTNNCGTGLPPGGSCTINVTFTPQVLGPQNGVLSVTDDATGSPQTVGLAGTGVSPMVLNPSSLNFGIQTVGATSAPMITTLTNVGIVAVTITSIVITGPNSSAFAQMNNCPASLAPNGSCTISVTFTPTALQSYSASLVVNDNALGSPTIAPLSGTGNGPILMITPPNLAFPEQYVGTSGLPQSVTLTNNGNGPLLITSVTTSPADFGSLNACGASVAVGASCSIGVFFDPTIGGTRNGALSIADNAAGSPQMIPLTGMGQDFSMSSSSSSSQTVSPGQSANYSIVIVPSGGFKQTIAMTCSGGPAGSTCTIPASVTLNGSSSTTITVTVATAGSAAMKSNSSRHVLAWLAFGLLGLPMIVGTASGTRKRGHRGRYTVLLLVITILSLVPSCGGGGGSSGGGTYPITVTGTFTSGRTTLTHTMTLTLIVQ